jgi:hypothetical protein
MSNYFMWGGRLARPDYMAGKIPTPQDWIIYFLVIPNYRTYAQEIRSML